MLQKVAVGGQLASSALSARFHSENLRLLKEVSRELRAMNRNIKMLIGTPPKNGHTQVTMDDKEIVLETALGRISVKFITDDAGAIVFNVKWNTNGLIGQLPIFDRNVTEVTADVAFQVRAFLVESQGRIVPRIMSITTDSAENNATATPAAAEAAEAAEAVAPWGVFGVSRATSGKSEVRLDETVLKTISSENGNTVSFEITPHAFLERIGAHFSVPSDYGKYELDPQKVVLKLDMDKLLKFTYESNSYQEGSTLEVLVDYLQSIGLTLDLNGVLVENSSFLGFNTLPELFKWYPLKEADVRTLDDFFRKLSGAVEQFNTLAKKIKNIPNVVPMGSPGAPRS